MQTQRIALNLVPGRGMPPKIYLSQYDDRSRRLEFELYDGTDPYDIPSATSIVIQGTKPDKKGFQYDCDYADGVASCIVAGQMTACGGNILCELVLSKDGGILGTAKFVIVVERAALSNETVISQTDMPMIEEAAKNALLADASAKDAAASASAAGTSETNAKASETAAKTSETNAASSATAAANSAAASQKSASDAASSATAAATSEINAKASAESATASKTAAATSEQNASNSANYARANATRAESYAIGGTSSRSGEDTDNAKYYAQQAKKSAEQAAGPHSVATSSADGLMSKADKAKLDGIGTGSNVKSVNGKTGAVTLAKSDVGLSSVANLDQSKAIKSIARSGATFTATALDGTTTTFSRQEEKSVTAGIVTVEDADGGDAGLTLNLEPHQSGSGDPSPDNIRPITGWTGAKVTKTGKNLLDDTKRNIVTDTTVYIGTTDVSYNTFLKAGTYTISCDFEENYGMYYRKSTDTTNRTLWNSGAATRQATFTIEEDGLFRFWVYRSVALGGVDASKIKTVQLEFGSTATGYEPYQGETYDIAFPSEAGTVYGGTLDVTTGELVVDRFLYVYDGTETDFRKSPTALNGFFNSIANNPLHGWPKMLNYSESQITSEISSMFKITRDVNTYKQNYGYVFLDSGMNFSCDPSIFGTTAKSFTAKLAELYENGTPVSVFAKLATPITYQLTPIEVTTLLGDNTIWMDAEGTIKLDYKTNAIATKGDINDHIANKSNPHAVTKAQVGLGSVANYDQSKAIKSITRNGTTFTATALDGTTTTFTQQDYPVATTSADGLMSKSDKAKLDGVADQVDALVTKTDNMKASFQAGVDGIYNAITAQGTTPASKSQSDVQAAIPTLANNSYNKGYANGYAAATKKLRYPSSVKFWRYADGASVVYPTVSKGSDGVWTLDIPKDRINSAGAGTPTGYEVQWTEATLS